MRQDKCGVYVWYSGILLAERLLILAGIREKMRTNQLPNSDQNSFYSQLCAIDHELISCLDSSLLSYQFSQHYSYTFVEGKLGELGSAL